MRNYWFTSDTHFFHTNIIKFTDKNGKRIRPFNSLYDMHETIADNWNSVVKDGDYVYHLGDVTFQYHRPFNELMARLRGSKRLIVGNHDRLKQQALFNCFAKISMWKGFKEHNFTCTHVPYRLEGLRDGAFNVHGHTHSNCMSDPHYINVCVEVRNYTPVNLDEILQEIRNVKN